MSVPISDDARQAMREAARHLVIRNVNDAVTLCPTEMTERRIGGFLDLWTLPFPATRQGVALAGGKP